MLATTKQPENNFFSDDYYEVLGLSRDCERNEIREAYKKLANQYHPDKENGDAERFKAIQEAFDVLSDHKRRAQYDEFGRFTDEEVSDVNAYITSVVEQVLKNEEVDLAYIDMVQTLKKTTESNLQNSRLRLAVEQKKKNRFEKNQHRAKSEVIALVFSKHKGLAIKQIEELEKSINLFEIAQTMIEDYEYIFDERPEPIRPGHIIWTTQ